MCRFSPCTLEYAQFKMLRISGAKQSQKNNPLKWLFIQFLSQWVPQAIPFVEDHTTRPDNSRSLEYHSTQKIRRLRKNPLNNGSTGVGHHSSETFRQTSPRNVRTRKENVS
jgi:hypothetical protein